MKTVMVDSKIPDDGDDYTQDRKVLDELFSLTYDELRRLAATIRRRDPGGTLNPTALVNEVWLKLAGSPRIGAASRLHFKRIAARAMRQVLVADARRRQAAKRSGASITFNDSLHVTDERDLLSLDAALADLAAVEPRQAMMVESRFFGGLEVSEIASLLDVSEATILRDWRAAKAWLAQELQRR